MIEEDLNHIIKWAEKQDREIGYYDDFESAWREIIEMLKELNKGFTAFFERAQTGICEGQRMKVEHLSRLKELIGIDTRKEIVEPEVRN